jgi:hypothetical protein
MKLATRGNRSPSTCYPKSASCRVAQGVRCDSSSTVMPLSIHLSPAACAIICALETTGLAKSKLKRLHR